MTEKIEQLVVMRLNTYFKTQTMTPALTELKTELATDLNEAANDKAANGRDPEAAVAEAFSDFGDINALIQQINAENGNNQNLHAHHVVMDDDGIEINDGETLKINADGIYLNGGRSFSADADGVSINNGAIKADSDGLKLGNIVINSDGINRQTQPDFRPDFGEPVPPVNLAGEYHDSLSLVNEQRFELATIKDLSIAYRSARVKVLPTVGGEDEIIVREYMNHNNAAYNAVTTQTGSALTIEQGKVPFLIPLRVHVQILIPVKFTGDLKLASHSGSVLMAGLPQLKRVNLRVTSGSCKVDTVVAQAFSADVVSGSLAMNHVQVAEQLGMLVKSGRLKMTAVQAGQYTVNVTSGSIQGTQLIGSGSWTARSGSMKLAFDQLTGNLNLNAKSGTIKFELPADASYHYELEAHSGRVIAPANAQPEHLADGYQTGQVGAAPKYKVQGRTTSGSIHLY
ncbi:DUF4097 family beta strand repeat-containing protein [Lactiplantibacillus sp. WILCCON 0030]|uniref:DUF4097 family beta strand repeat-containing protein n=1 Tax=Lactiplantibacillus brownii TaxID=3069269 RepID=A0ABU1A7K6_9LACO|nr:DUF4097 family beta strand repeat-containing protein [Lactiplantibacillus brownii]MDQ7936927.1 DUF4097 family beta strand repeat-containing protein [Lactiplantibacillus brownii]